MRGAGTVGSPIRPLKGSKNVFASRFELKKSGPVFELIWAEIGSNRLKSAQMGPSADIATFLTIYHDISPFVAVFDTFKRFLSPFSSHMAVILGIYLA